MSNDNQNENTSSENKVPEWSMPLPASEPQNDTAVTLRWYHKTWLICITVWFSVGSLIFGIAALALVWTHPKWVTKTKWIFTAVIAALLVFGPQIAKQDKIESERAQSSKETEAEVSAVETPDTMKNNNPTTNVNTTMAGKKPSPIKVRLPKTSKHGPLDEFSAVHALVYIPLVELQYEPVKSYRDNIGSLDDQISFLEYLSKKNGVKFQILDNETITEDYLPQLPDSYTRISLSFTFADMILVHKNTFHPNARIESRLTSAAVFTDGKLLGKNMKKDDTPDIRYIRVGNDYVYTLEKPSLLMPIKLDNKGYWGWHPCLKLGAKKGDTWHNVEHFRKLDGTFDKSIEFEDNDYNGAFTYTVKEFLSFSRDTYLVLKCQSPSGTQSEVWYCKGIGKVWSQAILENGKRSFGVTFGLPPVNQK